MVALSNGLSRSPSVSGDPEPGASSNKPCVECALQIPSNAKKCTNCNTYPDWRRYLTPGVLTVVSLANVLVLALNSYISWQTAFKRDPRTLIEISYHSFERFPEIQIGIANGGRLPLYVNQVNIYTSVQGGVYSHSINVDQRYEPAVQIPPHTDKMISIN